MAHRKPNRETSIGKEMLTHLHNHGDECLCIINGLCKCVSESGKISYRQHDDLVQPDHIIVSPATYTGDNSSGTVSVPNGTLNRNGMVQPD